MMRSVVAAALLVAVTQTAVAQAMTAADVQRCKAMAATMAPKKAEIEALQVKRDKMAESVEAKGEAWEDAEIHRLASASHAEKADQNKSAYRAAKKELMGTEQALQALARQFNQDIASYNQSCATDK